MRPWCVLVVVWGVGAAACGAKSQPSSADPGASIAPPPGTTRFADAAHDIVLRSETIVVSARVAAGATLETILRAEHMAAGDIARLIEKTAAVFDPRKVRSNQSYRLERALDGSFKRFEYEIDGDRVLRVTSADRGVPGGGGVDAAVLPIPKTRSIEHVTGQIDRASALVAAIEEAGETIDLTLEIADVLGGEIDFSTEVQPGDVRRHRREAVP